MCRYLRPGDSLPIGAAPEGLKPLALPQGWREKYAGGGRAWPWRTYELTVFLCSSVWDCLLAYACHEQYWCLLHSSVLHTSGWVLLTLLLSEVAS
jgi:hypothetical protein